ncbi:four helix bundle protein [candidate division WOR-3 bacterium]|nr:four helix bundle protein [candidate division WOR-3 bacterium]
MTRQTLDCRVQIAEGKAQSGAGKPGLLAERLLKLAAGCMGLGSRMHRTVPGRYVYAQLMRSSASAGANYAEARAGESRADFVHKLQLVLKELRETGYWLTLAVEGGLVTSATTAPLASEAEELTRMVARSVMTAKSGISASKPSAGKSRL